jgi:glycosyltransferase involved in cell wall biosynthesis
MKQPCVSVVIATYNRQHLLLETVDAILTQTMQDLEILIVDDASGDPDR